MQPQGGYSQNRRPADEGFGFGGSDFGFFGSGGGGNFGGDGDNRRITFDETAASGSPQMPEPLPPPVDFPGKEIYFKLNARIGVSNLDRIFKCSSKVCLEYKPRKYE